MCEKKIIKKIILLGFFILPVWFSMASSLHAVPEAAAIDCVIPEEWKPSDPLPETCNPTPISVTGAGDVEGIKTYIKGIMNILFPLLGVLAVYFLVVNGWNMVVFSHNETKAKEAQKGITWAIIGLIGVILSYAIIGAIIDFIYKAFSTPPS